LTSYDLDGAILSPSVNFPTHDIDAEAMPLSPNVSFGNANLCNIVGFSQLSNVQNESASAREERE
jgi:hypothetical protein